MSNIEKYISDGEVQRSKIALDVADGSISTSDIRDLCSDQMVKNAFIGTTYNKKLSKETWDASYLDQIVCASAAENFNQDYLLYLAEVGAYIRNKKHNNKKLIIFVISVLAVIAVIIGVVIWKVSNTRQ